MVIDSTKNSKKIYTVIHPTSRIEIQCTEKYLLQWLSRGFEVVSISVENFNKQNIDESNL